MLVVPHGDPYCPRRSARCRSRLRGRRSGAFFRKMAAGELPSVVSEGGGGPEHAQFICGFLGCDLRPFNPVLAALPRDDPSARAQPSPAIACATWSSSRCANCASSDPAGRGAAAPGRADVRRDRAPPLETVPETQTGWLAGLRDPLVARTLALLHGAAGARLDAGCARRAGRQLPLGAGRALRATRRPTADAIPDAVANAVGGSHAR